MSDPFLDSIEKTLENGGVPQKVTNRQLLAALRIVNEKLGNQVEVCLETEKRVGLLEKWQSKANGAMAAGMFLGGGGLLITVLKMFGI
jgi:hypothetical protein